MVQLRSSRYAVLGLVLLVAACVPRSRQGDDRRGDDDDDADWEGTWSGDIDGELHAAGPALEGTGSAQIEVDGSDHAVGSLHCDFDQGAYECEADVDMTIGDDEVSIDLDCLPDADVWLQLTTPNDALRVVMSNTDEFVIFHCGGTLSKESR